MTTQLAKWMDAMQIGDQELANKLGINRSYVALMRTGRRNMSDGFRWRFANAYGFDQARRILGETPVTNGQLQPSKESAR